MVSPMSGTLVYIKHFDFLSSLCFMSKAFYLNNGLNFGDILQQLAIKSQGDRHSTASTFTDLQVNIQHNTMDDLRNLA